VAPVILNKTCVPDSSLIFSTRDKITGPGVWSVVPGVRLRPLIPKTPRGIPTLIGWPCGLLAGAAPRLSGIPPAAFPALVVGTFVMGTALLLKAGVLPAGLVAALGSLDTLPMPTALRGEAPVPMGIGLDDR